MSMVAVGLRLSVHAAAQACRDLPLAVQALYDKVKRTEPNLVRALVAGSAQRRRDVLAPIAKGRAPTMRGYRLGIGDGNHLPASGKRIKPLCGFPGAALPGHSLVVYDPDLEMVVDLAPCEDGHAQEHAMILSLLERAQPGQSWVAERNFSTRSILCGWQRRDCGFIVREQAVTIENDLGQTAALLRIDLHLNEPTEEGDTVIRIFDELAQVSLQRP